MTRSSEIDGFQLAYDRYPGGDDAVVLLHGWPGDRGDFRAVVPLLPDVDLVVPDLRGFGASDKHVADPAEQYSAAAQARSVLALIAELGLDRPVLAGYDVGSRVAQTIARSNPESIGGLALSPPMPGVGERILAADPQREFWYQSFHQLPMSEELIDGRPEAVRSYLRHFWDHWSGPGFTLADPDLERLVEVYAAPGAFTASIGWYRAGAGTVTVATSERAPEPADRIAVPAHVLWPENDPLFPPAWSDRLGDFFADVELHHAPGAGHFTPVECPDAFAELVRAALSRRNGS